MKTVTVYRRDGSEAGTVGLPDEVFGIEPSMIAIYQVTKAHLSSRRQGNASTKSRGEINLAKQKLFRQKGTGRARAGSANSPIRVGGGVAFGPKSRSYKQKVNQKIRRLGLKSAYSIKASEDKIKVVEDFSLVEIKTREVADILKSLKIDKEKTFFLVKERDEILCKSSRNIPTLNVEMAENACTYDVMNADTLVFTRTALDSVKEIFKG